MSFIECAFAVLTTILKQEAISIVNLFERGGISFDISTAIGAWQYATTIARISQKYSKLLKQKFNTLERLHAVTQFNAVVAELETWTMRHQQAPEKKTIKKAHPAKWSAGQ